MKYDTKIIEVKTNISVDDDPHEKKELHDFITGEYLSVKLSDGRTVDIPKRSIIHNNGGLIGYTEYSNRSYINDLSDMYISDDEEVTIKLKVKTPVLPHFVPKFIVKLFTKTSIIPYWSCDCWSWSTPRTVSIYTKEKFEEHDESRKMYLDFVTSSLPDGEYVEILKFCPYYISCISFIEEKVFISNTGEEISEMECLTRKMEKKKIVIDLK